MCTDNKLPNDLASCHEIIRELIEQNQQLQARMDYLARRLFGRSSERLTVNPDQLELFAVEDKQPSQQPPDDKDDTDGDDCGSGPAAGSSPRKKGHGRKPFGDNLECRRVEHDLAEHEKVCAECGAAKQRFGEDVSRQLDYVPASLHVVEHVRPKYACPVCEGQVAQATKPAEAIDKGLAGPGLLAYVLTSKYADHLPLYRLERIFSRHGVELSRKTMSGWAMSCAELLSPLVKAARARLLSSHVVGSDDTRLRVHDGTEQGKCHQGYLWVYVGDASNPYTLYDFTWTRCREGPLEFLSSYKGYLVADAYAGYNGVLDLGAIHVGCWAHVRRYFFEAKTSDVVLALEGLRRIGQLFEIERLAKSLDAKQRVQLRQDRSLEKVLEFFNWCEEQQKSVVPKSPIGEAFTYALNNEPALVRYCFDGTLPIDNNVSERAMRCVAVGRKNWLFTASKRGGEAMATLLSLVESAKRALVDPFVYLRDVLSRISTHPHSRIEELLPDQWKRLHSGC